MKGSATRILNAFGLWEDGAITSTRLACEVIANALRPDMKLRYRLALWLAWKLVHYSQLA